MKKNILLLLFSLLSITILAQNKEDAEKFVNEGIASHDKGDYLDAISKYDRALELDTYNFLALSEKALTLVALERYDESIQICQKVIKKYIEKKDLKTVYVTYGNALDGLGQSDKAINIYDEGIRLFPDFYSLYFNKGITLTRLKKYDEAILSFQQSVRFNPEHVRSHILLARILSAKNERIPSILANCRSLVLEPKSSRAKENLTLLQETIKRNVNRTANGTININISQNMLPDTLANTKSKENDFSTTDLILSMDAALDYDEKNNNKTEVEQFIRKLNTICASLKEIQHKNYGFYWDYYVPYFIEIKDKGLVETFAYIAFSSSANSDVSAWLKSHQDTIDQFYAWSKSFKWKIS